MELMAAVRASEADVVAKSVGGVVDGTRGKQGQRDGDDGTKERDDDDQSQGLLRIGSTRMNG